MQPTSPVRGTGLIGSLARLSATLFVLAVLAGLAIWGHHTGWRLTGSEKAPSSSQGQVSSHWLEIVPDRRAFCEAHGVHVCPLCQPASAEVAKLPHILPEDHDRTGRALAFQDRPRNNPACELHRRRVHFASEEAVARAGIDIAPVWTTGMTETARAPGEVIYDPTRCARLAARAGGSVWRVLKQLGDRVSAGDVLAVIDAADVGKAKAELLLASTQVRLRSSTLEGLRSAGPTVPERQVREAEAAVNESQVRLVAAQQALANLGLPVEADDLRKPTTDQLMKRLQFLGLPDELTRALPPATTTANLIPLVAPLDGEVIRCDIVAGEVVDTSRILFVVADARRLWLTLGLRPDDAPLVRAGQTVRFHPDGVKEEVTGALTWVSTAVDEKTRTVPARVGLVNANGRLRNGTFGVGKVVLREERKAIVVPNEALLSDHDCSFVFVRGRDYLSPAGAKTFQVRTVRLGARDEQQTEIIAGLWPGEVVAVKGTAFLRSEAMRNLFGSQDAGHPRD